MASAGSRRSGRRGRRNTTRPIAEINVTPFVDVMLVLLVIFMVAAPMLTVGVPLDLPDTGESPERALLRGELARHLHEAIRALPDRLDEVVERNFFGDESLTEIAEDLGVTLSRVSQMRARALTLLHAAMSEVWDGTAVPAQGGVRARNQQRSYVDRVAGRGASGSRQRARARASLRRRKRAAMPVVVSDRRCICAAFWLSSGRSE